VTGVQTCALPIRSEEHTSELQSPIRISYAVFCLKKKTIAHAQAIVDAFAENPGAGVVAIGGVMVDRPHLTQAKRVLARATSAPGHTRA